MRLVARRPESSWLEPGVLVDGHQIVSQVHGHFGPELRYLARSPDDMPTMVISTRHTFTDRRERSRFRRVSAARAVLDHPAAIRIWAVTEHANQPVLISDPYPECTLDDLLEHDAPLAPDRVVRLLAPVAEALDRAHAAGVVHSTLSAESLLLAGRERLLLDAAFGLLAEEEGGWSLLEGRDVRYISPEQVRGLPALPSSNVYSLTALIVHALTGEPPFTGEPPAVLYAHVIKAPAKVSERRPELGERIDAVVDAGLAKAPERRPSSAVKLLQMAADALRVPRPDAQAPRQKPRLRLVTDDHAPVTPRPNGRDVGGLLTAAVVAASIGLGAVGAIAVAPFGDDESPPAPRAPVTGTWNQVADTRGELRDRLAAADTPTAQAEAASGLAGLYEAAARTGRPRGLAAAAREAGLAYKRLAAAAELNDDAGYAEAAQAVERAEARLSLAASRR